MQEEELYAEIGTLIATRRSRLDLTQAELARRVNMSRPSVANVEVGRQRVLVHQLYAFAKALEIEDPRDLLPLPSIGQKAVTAPIASSDLTARERDQINRLVATA